MTDNYPLPGFSVQNIWLQSHASISNMHLDSTGHQTYLSILVEFLLPAFGKVSMEVCELVQGFYQVVAVLVPEGGR